MREALTLYLREGCSLCEQFLVEIEPYRRQLGFSITVQDVDREEHLRERYGELVPVLQGGDGEICHYFFDPDALSRYFAKP